MTTWSEFRQLISQHFDAEELRILCFDLDVDYDNLPGERKDLKVAELIDHLRNHQRIPELVNALNNMRPPIHWEEILAEWETDKRSYHPTKAVLAAGSSPPPSSKNKIWLFAIGGVLLLVIIIGMGLLFNNLQSDPEIAKATIVSPTGITATVTPNNLASIIEEFTNTPTPTLTKTAVPATITPTPTPSATLTLVEPVPTDEYMVLVAEPEYLSGSERTIARFLADTLKQQLEVTLPNSRIHIREFDQDTITSKQEALAFADQVGADIIIWGNYDDDGVYLNLQIGSLHNFPDSSFSREELAKITDVRINLTDERNQSLAIPIIFTLVQMATAASDTPEMSRLVTMTDFLPTEPVEIEGNSIAAHYHRGLFYFIEDPAQTLPELDAALLLDQNPLIYLGRGIAHAKLGDMRTALSDWQSAARLAPDGWFMPQASLSFGASMAGYTDVTCFSIKFFGKNEIRLN